MFPLHSALDRQGEDTGSSPVRRGPSMLKTVGVWRARHNPHCRGHRPLCPARWGSGSYSNAAALCAFSAIHSAMPLAISKPAAVSHDTCMASQHNAFSGGVAQCTTRSNRRLSASDTPNTTQCKSAITFGTNRFPANQHPGHVPVWGHAVWWSP